MKQYYLFLLAALAIIAILAFAYVRQRQSEGKNHYFVSAATPREGGVRQWEKLLGPPKPAPKPDPAMLTSIKPKIDQQDQILFDYTTTDTTRGEEMECVIEDNRNKSIDEAASSTIRILGFETDMITVPPEASESEDEPNQGTAETFFAFPDGTPMDEDSARQMVPYHTLAQSRIQADSHRFKIFYEINGLDSPRVIAQRLYDRNTRVTLSGSYSYSKSQSTNSVDYDMHCWRSMPMDWMIDIAHGPVQTREIEAAEGSCAVFDDVQLRIMKVIPGEAYRWTSGSSSNNASHFEVKIKNDQETKNTLIFYTVSPACQHNSLSMEILDAEGNVINRLDLYGNTPNLGQAELHGFGPEQIHRIRVIYRPETRRVVMPIDAIPGFPRTDPASMNLANVTIPYFRFENSYEMDSAIRQLFQLNSINNDFAMNNQSQVLTFPRSYTHVTAGQLLDDWLIQYPGCRVSFDETNGTIEIKRPKTFKQRIHEIIRKVEEAIWL